MMMVKQSRLCVPYHQTTEQLLSSGCETPQCILSTLPQKHFYSHDLSNLDNYLKIAFMLVVLIAYVGQTEPESELKPAT